MKERYLTTPLKTSDLADLRIGDLIYLNGSLVTGRDQVYERIVLKGLNSPQDLAGLAVFHAGPIIRETGERTDKWEVLAAGPTTSMRMESCQAEFFKATGAKLIIGKGGMGVKTAEACRELEAVHAVFPGGCAVLAAAGMKARALHWPELGMGEAMWVLEVKDFGPLVISIDSAGNNLFQGYKRQFEEKKAQALKNLRFKA